MGIKSAGMCRPVFVDLESTSVRLSQQPRILVGPTIHPEMHNFIVIIIAVFSLSVSVLRLEFSLACECMSNFQLQNFHTTTTQKPRVLQQNFQGQHCSKSPGAYNGHVFIANIMIGEKLCQIPLGTFFDHYYAIYCTPRMPLGTPGGS